ncbi:hypothetical protein AVEN_28122-1 [Araneus ventricosus]|uniref:RNA-directed DNA polymerase from transposon BS n=1 Tax=Araneus ventricosus TaxID=182803 RepID=A0A4Y2MMQ5_ARAVE|nr:hypothetical protein AVEN_28122-1 [Araneus ventricosus]
MGNFYSNHFIQTEGVPQGSVLSVTLFIIHLSQILNCLPPYVHGSLYVDDLQISCQGSNMNMIERQLQHAVNKLVAWCDKNGHTISAEKSRCVHFCRKRNIHLDPNIQIRNAPIPVVNEIRFLGVIFDRKLTFLPHTLHLRKKCERSLNILKVLSRTSWGADRTSLLRIYQAVILSRIDYGCMVYGSARPTVLRRLDTIHHSALRICTGAFRTSPVESLYIMSHQLPLHLRRQKISALYSFRAQSVRKNPINQLSLPSILRRLYAARPSHILPLCERTKMLLHDSDLNNVSVQFFDFFTFPPWDIPQFSFLNPFSGFDKSSTAPITLQQLFHHHRYQYSSFVPIFTDGSKSDGHVGCGVVFPSDTLSYRLHTCCSVFTAELVAIFYALQEILHSNQRNFIIYTDSMSALETLSHYDNRIHPVALEILSVLQFLRNKGFNIIFCWVPSHVGISGNETADIIARFASDFLPRALPYCDIRKFLISHFLSVWQQKWNLLTNNKLYSVKPSIGLWSALPMRELDVKLTRLRIGHTRFTHRHLFLGQRAPRCPTCQADFTVQHILIECPSFKCHREYHFNSSSLTLQDLVVEKAITSSVGDVKATKKLRSGDLLVEVESPKQAKEISKLKSLSTIPVTVKPHATLNSSKGVISCGELLNESEEKIIEELKSQGVIHVRRITIRRDGQLLNTKHLILTFDSNKLPENIKAGYMRLSVRTYIPNPLRCFKCQRFGHSKTSCRGTLTCARCAEVGHESTDCTRTEKCVNCKGEHASFSRNCFAWKQEKEIISTKIKKTNLVSRSQKTCEIPDAYTRNCYVSAVKKSTAPSTQTNQDISADSSSKQSVPIPSTPPAITNLSNPSIPSVAPLCENTSASPDLTDFTLVTNRKKLKKDSPSKTNNSISTAEKISKFYTTSSRKVTNPIPTKDNISSQKSTLKLLETTKPTTVDIDLLPMAVLPPLEKRILQTRDSDADAEMSSSSLSEEDALEYHMSEDLEDSPAVVSPSPPSKPEKANKYKNR